MNSIHDLSRQEAAGVLSHLAAMHGVVVLAYRQGNRWITIPCRIQLGEGNTLVIELPVVDPSLDMLSDGHGEVGLSFRYQGDRYQASTVAVGKLREPGKLRSLIIETPSSIRRICRRGSPRFAVPHDWLGRATFWLGGLENQPAGGLVNPQWSGRIIDVSSNGLQVRTQQSVMNMLVTGELIGTKVGFFGRDVVVSLDARLRHMSADGEMALMGLEFAPWALGQWQSAVGSLSEAMEELTV